MAGAWRVVANARCICPAASANVTTGTKRDSGAVPCAVAGLGRAVPQGLGEGDWGTSVAAHAPTVRRGYRRRVAPLPGRGG